MAFLYAIFLKLLYPTSLCVVLLLGAAVFRMRRRLSRTCFWAAVSLLMVAGNGWLVGALAQRLEWRNLPPDPLPRADCIIVLSGGILNQVPPRQTIEIGDSADRILYAAHLFRQGKAPLVICTGNVGTGGVAVGPAAADMTDLLGFLGVPKASVVAESESGNTHEHARNLRPMLESRGLQSALLVTSARHMPRSLGVFRKACPSMEFIPAPTDFGCTRGTPAPLYRRLTGLIPTPRNLLDFSEVMHEYLGIAYYRARGWM